jgi:hypothetical protein
MKFAHESLLPPAGQQGLRAVTSIFIATQQNEPTVSIQDASPMCVSRLRWTLRIYENAFLSPNGEILMHQREIAKQKRRFFTLHGYFAPDFGREHIPEVELL